MRALCLVLELLCFLGVGTPSWAAVSCALLTQNSDATNVDNHSTASVTPTSNALVLVFWRSVRNGTDGLTTPTITGNSLTWVPVTDQRFSQAGAPESRITVVRSLGASPSAGAINAAYDSAVTNVNASWAVVECTGIDTSGTNGSGAVVQSTQGVQLAGTSLTLTLAAFGSAGNATIAGFALDNDLAITNEGGYTELADTGTDDSGLGGQLEVEFLASNDTSPSATYSSADAGGVAIEIKAAAAAGSETFGFRLRQMQ